MTTSYVGNGRVVLIASPGRVLTDVAAKFVGSEKSLDDIISSPYDREIVRNIMNSGHRSACEFDGYVFGVEGYSRVTEVQLVRKRLASYMIKSGRKDKNGSRSWDMVYPSVLENFSAYGHVTDADSVDHHIKLNVRILLDLIEQWYEVGVGLGYNEQDLRYVKPQATEFKAIVGMNCHSLLDWFSIRCCMNAQDEIRDLANKMLALVKDATPDLFINAGPSCKQIGYCPEGRLQNSSCRGKIPTKDEAFNAIKKYYDTK